MNDRQALEGEVRWRRAKADLIWLTQFWYIQHPLGSRTWELYPAQRQILDAWATGENYIHLKARQIGFSTSVAFFSFWIAFFNPETKVLLLSKGEREASELLDKVKFGYDRLPEWLKERGPAVEQWTQSKISFGNGSEISSLPSANNPARGFTGRLVVVDEWAFLNNSEEAWASIEPVADIGGQIIGLSTANGVGNLFHFLWTNAERGRGSFTSMFFPWWSVPGRDQAWYDGKSEDMQPWQLHQEYPSDPEEAFIKSGATVFDIESLKQLPREIGVKNRIGGAGTRNPQVHPNAGGELTVFEEPVYGHAYTIGADVAEGLEHGDYSSAHVIDLKTNSVVAIWHGHIPADLFADELFALGIWYNTALIGPEANNHGLTTITRLRNLQYPKIFRRQTINKVKGGYSSELGFRTTRTSKPQLIDGLATWVREGGQILEEETIREMYGFVRDANGSMNGSPHDDKVISLALAVWMLQYVHLPEYKVEVDNTYTFDWWVEQAHAEDPKTTGIRGLRQQVR